MGEKITPQQVIANRIIELIEQGNLPPWRKPWRSGVNDIPKNLITKKPYRGINLFTLLMAPYTSPYFISFKQIAERGGKIKKGEKAWPVLFWKFFDAEEDDDGNTFRRPPICRYYNVFNVEQCESIEYPAVETVALTEHQKIESCEKTVDGYQNRPIITNKQFSHGACYTPINDEVSIPVLGQFETPEKYYATLFHELVHSTGHEKRLARDGITDKIMFGSHKYSKEELIAEFGAAFLCGINCIEQDTIENQTSYIKSWLKKLKSDPKILIESAQAAQKAIDYILGQKFENNELVEENSK